MKWGNGICGLVFAVAIVAGSTRIARCEALLFHASASGHQTMDQDEAGGNPFATSLIEIVQRKKVLLSELPAALRSLTVKKSSGFQTPDVPNVVSNQDWKITPPRSQEKRIALVLVVSNYERSGAQSLPGAAYDAKRIEAALAKAGFETEIALNLDLSAMRKKLKEFSASSSNYDAAAIYTTGHGVEENGAVYLVPGEFPISEGHAALPSKALPLLETAASARAKSVNLIFYGACRDNPL